MHGYILHFILKIAFVSTVTLGLRITKVLVPKYVNVGDSPKLFCDFDLEDDELNYVMWYKDGAEFSKIMPKQLVQTQERRGIMVDKYNSTERTIFLKDVTLFSSGLYKCKVASKGNLPKVKETGARAMLIVERPNKVEILTSKESYIIGEQLKATCTSYLSNPTALISWTINGKRISLPQHESGKKSPVIMKDYLTGIQNRQTVYTNQENDNFFKGKNSSLELQFRVQKKYLKSGIKLECQAHIGDLYVPASRSIPVIQSTGKGSTIKNVIRYVYVSLIFTFILK